MKILLDRTSARDGRLPLAGQIRAHVERLIRQGLLRPGTKLPATRELAQTLGVNRTTVAAAYEDLVAGGWVHAHVGQGTFVSETLAERAGPLPPPAARLDWGALASRRSQAMSAELRRGRVALAALRVAPGVISFAGGMPDSALFPTEAFRRVLNAVVRSEGRELLQYYQPAGYLPLRRFLAGYLLRFGLEARPEEILIVNGSQQGFDLIARTLLDPGDAVALEEPTYPRAVQVFRAYGAELLPVPITASGLDVDHLERIVERRAPKLVYCQPSAHNPTGLTLGLASRRRLLEIAGRHRVAVLEDGFDGTLFYGERPPGPLKAIDSAEVVVYVGTFSKILFPGLRLGWVVAPAELIERLETAKQVADIHTSPLLQAAVYHFCQRRLLDRHQARILTEYGRRRQALLGALQRHLPSGTTWTEIQGGFTTLVTLPRGLEASTLLPRALARGVAFTPGEVFFVDGGGEGMLRLSFSGVTVEQIEEGVRRLGLAVDEAEQPGTGASREREPAVQLI